jgi:hypothetical protein
MTEVVPADHLPHNPCPMERGTNVPLEQVVGTHRFLALEPDRREDEIRIRFVERFPFPFQQRFKHQWVKGSGTPRCGILAFAETVANSLAKHGDFEVASPCPVTPQATLPLTLRPDLGCEDKANLNLTPSVSLPFARSAQHEYRITQSLGQLL